METDRLKYFELNNGVLKDFDKLMSMHLDYVEELKVTEIGANSKLLNIISLCINIKTIIIEGDQRINTNSIVSNVCKPELLENLVLTNVKLPSGHTLKKLTGIKSISLNNIRFTNIGAFFKEIVNPEKIEEIEIINSDFEKNSIKILERFENIKKLTLKNVSNCKLKELDFLTTNKNLEYLTIQNSNIEINEINNLLKGKMNKTINCEIDSEENSKIKDRFEINEEGQISLTLNSINLEQLVNNVNIYKVDKFSLILKNTNNLDEYIKPLKKVKGSLSVLIKDVSQLTKNDAKKLKERLKIEFIDMLSTDETTVEESYAIEDYIFIREEIEKYTNRISKHLPKIQRFLEMYKLLSKEIIIDDNFTQTTQELNNLKNELIEKKCLSIDFAKILQNCLACMKIESIVVSGKLIKLERAHNWNQVKLDGQWYNLDIALDSANIRSNNILKRKSRYCLLSDEAFNESHYSNNSNQNYAPSDFDKKILNVYFKTGIFSDDLLKSYFKTISGKFKLLLKMNSNKALPAPTEIKNKDNKSE